MENVFADQKFKMGVDHASSIFENAKKPVADLQCMEGNVPEPVLVDPVLEKAKDLLRSMPQSTALISHVIKPFGTPEKRLQDCSKEGVVQGKLKRNDSSFLIERVQGSKKRFSTENKSEGLSHCAAFARTIGREQDPLSYTVKDEVTLNLEPISLTHEVPGISWKSSPYYTRVPTYRKLVILQTSCVSDIAVTDGTGSTVKKIQEWPGSTVKKIQEWHTKHLEKLRYSNAVNAAMTKPKALAAMKDRSDASQCHHDIPNASQRTNYFAVSNRYYRYLNRPKQAKHEAFKIVFRARILIDSVPVPPDNKTLYPQVFVSWPSGKIPLSGYKPTNVIRSMQHHDGPKKRKRTYRVAKPRPKYNPVFRHFSPIQRRKPVWAPKKPVPQKRFFSVMRDPDGKKFTAPTATKSLLNGQWFGLVSSIKSKSPIPEIRKKFGVSGAPLRPSPVASLGSQLYRKSLLLPIPIQQNTKKINVVFNCETIPEPFWFTQMEDYASICVLYQVRKIMAATAMSCGFIEDSLSNATHLLQVSGGQAPGTTKDDENNDYLETTTERAVSNSLVLVSSQTEGTFALWSSRLPNAKEMDNILDNAIALPTSKSDRNVCAGWLHTCNGDVVQKPPQRRINLAHSVDDELSLEALKAWHYDALSGEDLSPVASGFGITHYAEDQQCSASAQVESRASVGFAGSASKLCNRAGNWKCNFYGKKQLAKMQRSMSWTRSIKTEVHSIQKDANERLKPSYCVRYRMCFCTNNCACCTKVWLAGEADNSRMSESSTNQIEHALHCNATPHALQGQSFPDTTLNGYEDEKLNDFSKKSDTFPMHLGSTSDFGMSPSKWDMKKRSSYSESFGAYLNFKFETQREKCRNDTISFFFRRGSLQFIKKIGETEIYHQWAIRRFHDPEFNPPVLGTESTRSTKIVHRKAIKRKGLGHYLPENFHVQDEFIKVKNQARTEITNRSCVELMPDNAFGILRRGGCANVAKGSNMVIGFGKISGMVISNVSALARMEHCFYRAGKKLLAAIAKDDILVFSKFSLDIIKSEDRVEAKNNKLELPVPAKNRGNVKINLSSLCSKSSIGGHSLLSVGHGCCQICWNAMNECKHFRADLPMLSCVEVTSNDRLAEGSSIFVKGKEIMSNGLLKPMLLHDGLVMPSQPNFVKEGDLPHNIKNGLAFTDMRHVGRDAHSDWKRRPVPNFRSEEFCQEVTEWGSGDGRRSLDTGVGCTDLHNVTATDKAETGVISLKYYSISPSPLYKKSDNVSVTGENISIRSNDAERKTTSTRLQSAGQPTPEFTSLAVCLLQSGGEPLHSGEKNHTDCEQREVISASVIVKRDEQIPPKNGLIESREPLEGEIRNPKGLEDDGAKNGVSNMLRMKTRQTKATVTGTKINLPVETRTSRRLRLKIGNKRGRYETDYIADWPRSNKKRKVQPYRDYDNDKFWQFYRDCEKSVYAKNLVLQQKYIKLLKSKAIVSAHSAPANCFGRVITASSSASVNKELTVVPTDGLMSFMRRLTKPKKTEHELPKVPDDRCAYCGFSFVGRGERFSENHRSRHGKRYTILTAPPPQRKRKKMNAGRKGMPLKKTRLNSGNLVTMADSPVKDDPTSKTKNNCVKFQYLSSSQSSDLLSKLAPLPRPTHLSMGHRKQTARKSFSITSTLPKNVLIAALECKMRAQPNIPTEKKRPASSNPIQVNKLGTLSNRDPRKSTELKVVKDDIGHGYFAHSARKTLTGLPITYRHLHNSLVQTISPTKSHH